MNRQQQILELARTKGIIRARDVEALGISRNYLYRMHNKGLLEKNATGLYILPDAPITENTSMAEVAKRMPHAVVCLISALSYHGITTQIPHEIWLAVPRGSWRPAIDHQRANNIPISAAAAGIFPSDVIVFATTSFNFSCSPSSSRNSTFFL